MYAAHRDQYVEALNRVGGSRWLELGKDVERFGQAQGRLRGMSNFTMTSGHLAQLRTLGFEGWLPGELTLAASLSAFATRCSVLGLRTVLFFTAAW